MKPYSLALFILITTAILYAYFSYFLVYSVNIYRHLTSGLSEEDNTLQNHSSDQVLVEKPISYQNLSENVSLSLPILKNVPPTLSPDQNPSTLSQNLSEIDLEFSYNYSVLLNKYCLTKSHLYALPYFAGNNHDIHSFKALAQHYINEEEFKGFWPQSVECGEIVWVKTDYVDSFIQNWHGKINSPYILMTQDSDFAVGSDKQLKFLNDSKVIVWFGQNVMARYVKRQK